MDSIRLGNFAAVGTVERTTDFASSFAGWQPAVSGHVEEPGITPTGEDIDRDWQTVPRVDARYAAFEE